MKLSSQKLKEMIKEELDRIAEAEPPSPPLAINPHRGQEAMSPQKLLHSKVAKLSEDVEEMVAAMKKDTPEYNNHLRLARSLEIFLSFREV